MSGFVGLIINHAVVVTIAVAAFAVIMEDSGVRFALVTIRPLRIQHHRQHQCQHRLLPSIVESVGHITHLVVQVTIVVVGFATIMEDNGVRFALVTALRIQHNHQHQHRLLPSIVEFA